MSGIVASVLQHYESHLGALVDVAALHRGVRVLKFKSPFDDQELALATDGVRDADAPPGQRAIEFVMLCRPTDAADVAPVLCQLAHYPREHGTTLHWFHVLPLGLGVVPGSSLTSLLLTMPWFGRSEFTTASDGDKRVDVVHVIPITEQEHELFRSSGTDALEQALEDADADLTDFRRPSVV